ncbi:phospholipase effector Tle1 domain-containing protein [Fibrobacterota bacterium]
MLNIGVFFDGTNNNKRGNPSQVTNVGKLSNVYPTDDPNRYAAIYVRGVGSTAVTKQDKELDDEFYEGKIMGGAFGYGGLSRINYALEMLEGILAGYQKRKGRLPGKLVFDVFGFSRGAALARHFVNVIYHGTCPQPILKKIKDKKTRFLGIFDTVGSFGWPGNKKDPGYNFHVNTHKAQYVYHLVSEDELRENFDLQSIKSSARQVVNEKKAKGKVKWMIEEEHPGVHAESGRGIFHRKQPRPL